MSRHVALVMGNHRSGTTLLGAMLGSHSGAAMLGEVNQLANVRKKANGSRRTGGTCVFCDGPCPVWDERVPWHFLPAQHGRLAGRLPSIPFLRGYYETLFAATGARVLVDTSKNLSWSDRRRRDEADWTAARPCFVFITRDGRGTLASWLRKRPKIPAEEHVSTWVESARDLKAAYAAFDPKSRIALRYEDLVADPAGTLASVCDALGLEFEPGMVEYWRHDHHPVTGNLGTLSLIARWRSENGKPVRKAPRIDRDQSLYHEQGLAIFNDQRWQTELSPATLAVFEAGAGDLNRSLGYS